jgi:hypothetical protein
MRGYRPESSERPRWTPEPLHLPVERPRDPREKIEPTPAQDRSTDDDLPGSHVIVIDLA